MPTPSILAADIGGGTQDILLIEPDQPLENAVKLVLPSPTVIAARRIRKATKEGRPLFLSGRVMGGGAISGAVKGHLAAGLPVYSLEGPALTLHDNLDKVRSLGVNIVADRPEGEAAEVVLGDLDFDTLGRVLAMYEVAPPEIIALAVQDHGFSPDFSNRLTRFQQWQKFLDDGGRMDRLLFTQPPANLTRWRAAAEVVPGAFFMDTASAALRGAVLDDYAAPLLDRGLVVINAGNEHTVGFLVKGDEVFGVYEHHTGLLKPEILAEHMRRFTAGTLTNQEIFDQWGHGLAYRPGYGELPPFEPVVITGPRRELARGLGHMAAPYGEMMLSGCFGLAVAVRGHLDNDSGPERGA